MNILIIGVGYVGLVTGTCFAEMGHCVTCLDINPILIRQLQQGLVSIYEPGLEEMVKRNITAGRLTFTTDYASAVSMINVCFIAVDTPTTMNGAADISQVEKVASTLSDHLEEYCVVVTKSTVPAGTTLHIAQIIQDGLAKRKANFTFDIVSNPEFLKEGNAIQDFMKPDRIIIGINNPAIIPFMKEVYSPFMFNHDRLLVMDILSAELAKYAANAMLATRISFMNEMAVLCENIGANIQHVRQAIGTDVRIGNKFLYPGAGYGGSCLPKDVKALIYQGQKSGCDLKVLQAVEETNQKQKKIIGRKIISYFESRNGIKGKTIGILGLSFKPDTDDIREASSLVLIEELLQLGVSIRVFDPIAMPKAQKFLGHNANIYWCCHELEVAENADAIVLMTEWKQFRLINLNGLLSKMKGCGFFDGRNQYQADEMARKGFDYFSIGHPPFYSNNYCSSLINTERKSERENL